MKHLVAILVLALLCAGWIAIQFLARKAGTKNHLDSCEKDCGSCNCFQGDDQG